MRAFGCPANVLRLRQLPKFESRVVGEVYLKTLKHRVYRILTDEGIERTEHLYRIIKSRHVTFDETCFLGAFGFGNVMK